MFSLQLSAHERSHQRSSSAQPLVKPYIIIVVSIHSLLISNVNLLKLQDEIFPPVVKTKVGESLPNFYGSNVLNNKLASLEATLVRNYDSPTHRLTD